MSLFTNLGFREMTEAQQGTEYVHNENLNRLDAFGDNARAINRLYTQPPKSMQSTPFQLEFAPGGDNRIIRRGDGGSWTTDGFQALDSLLVSGSTKHDGIYVVGSTTANDLTLHASSPPLPQPYDYIEIRIVNISASYQIGETYIVNSTGTGAWAGHDDAMASWYFGWQFQDPFPGLRCYLTQTGQLAIYHAWTWQLESLPLP